MPRMPPAVAALAALALRCSALQVASDADTAKPCEGELSAFEAPSPLTGICSVFCLPPGDCVQRGQVGELRSRFGITEAGNCQRRGYTQEVEFGNTTLRIVKYLKYTVGACKGMTLIKKYKKPDALTVPGSGAPGKQVCPYEQVPFVGMSPAYPGMCSRFCVPEGACQERAMRGAFAYLGLTGPGDCEAQGFTFEAASTNLTRQTESYLSSLVGACHGMKLTKFQKPPIEGLEPGGPLCSGETTAFAGIAPLNPHLCSVYCVPEGECVGRVQMGAMNAFGITGEGNCKKLGFTELLPRAKNASKYVLNAPCKGIERFNFLRPGRAGQ